MKHVSLLTLILLSFFMFGCSSKTIEPVRENDPWRSLPNYSSEECYAMMRQAVNEEVKLKYQEVEYKQKLGGEELRVEMAKIRTKRNMIKRMREDCEKILERNRLLS